MVQQRLAAQHGTAHHSYEPLHLHITPEPTATVSCAHSIRQGSLHAPQLSQGPISNHPRLATFLRQASPFCIASSTSHLQQSPNNRLHNVTTFTHYNSLPRHRQPRPARNDAKPRPAPLRAIGSPPLTRRARGAPPHPVGRGCD
jgi:hypothetical protein